MSAVSPETTLRPAPALPICVLVVEDDPIVRRLVRVRLRQAGVRVLTASTGEEAISISAARKEAIHLVITDGVMPGIDGFEVARHFSHCGRGVRVILMSGYLHHFTSRPDIPANIEAFFEKPFSPDALAAKVLDLLGAAA